MYRNLILMYPRCDHPGDVRGLLQTQTSSENQIYLTTQCTRCGAYGQSIAVIDREKYDHLPEWIVTDGYYAQCSCGLYDHWSI